ncbi:MAG: DUF4157 domain-containing protein [Cyanobacteria bacterium P01_G01_bin.54]
MAYRRTYQSSSQTPKNKAQGKKSRFTPNPFPIQAKRDADRPPTSEEIERKAFNQHKTEASGLQLKVDDGTITPIEQERLGVLQAKMDAFRAKRRERDEAKPNIFERLINSSQAAWAAKPQANNPANTIQAKDDRGGARPEPTVEQKSNKTGLPDALKTGVENLSGYSLDNVQVHYNSPKPAQIQALAYTQGTDIHVAPGQEKHLPHEAWHVVQQQQGRVKPTLQAKGVAINDDVALEQEADVMGMKALQIQAQEPTTNATIATVQPGWPTIASKQGTAPNEPVKQRVTSNPHSIVIQKFDRWSLYYQPLILIAVGYANQTIFNGLNNWNSESVYNLARNYAAGNNGRTAEDWVAIANQLPNNDHASTTTFARIQNWNQGDILQLLQNRNANGANGLNANDWAMIVSRVEVNDAASAATFAQLPGWAWAEIDPLTAAFAANPQNRLPADLWINIATRFGNAAHQNAIAFAQLPGWTWIGLDPLTNAFLADANGLTANQWSEIAQRCGNDNSEAAIAFAQLQGWTWAGIDLLTAAFATNPGNINLGRWFAIAKRMANDDHDNTIGFCQLPGWNWPGLDPLTQFIQQHPGVLTVAQWFTVAQRMPANRSGEAIDFASLPNWNWAGIDLLTYAFKQDANTLTAQNWIDIAKRCNNNAHGDAIAFAQLANWNWTGIGPLTDTFANHNTNQLTAQNWIDIAKRCGNNAHGDAIAFAQLANWNWTGIGPLTDAFKQNANTLTAQNWIDIAKRCDNNAHGDAIAFAQLAGWAWGEINLLTQAFKAAAYGLAAQAWRQIAAYGGAQSAIVIAFLAQVQVHNAGTGFGLIDGFITKYPNITLGQLTALLQQVANRGSILELTSFLGAVRYSYSNAAYPSVDTINLLQAIQNHWAGATISSIETFVQAIKKNGDFQDLKTLVNTIAAHGTIAESTALLKAIEKHNKGTTITNTDTLLAAIQNHNPGTAIVDTTNLINAVVTNGKVPETTALVNTVAGKSTINDLTALVTAIQNHNANTPVPQIDALVQAINGGGNVCTALTAIVNAVQNNGTVPQMTAMIGAATPLLGVANMADLLPLINRNPGQNTPPNVQALVTAMNTNGRNRVDFVRIQPKIARFTRQAAPNHPQRDYNAAGAVTPPAAGPVVFTCTAWRHFYKRHSYTYFDFATPDLQNSMWAPGVNVVNALDVSITLAITNGLMPGILNSKSGGNNEVGCAGGGVIAQLYPIGGNVDEDFNRAEINAIANLR